MPSIEEIYKDFGSDVMQEVQSQIELHGSLMPLLKRLGIPSLPGILDQHHSLTGFIYRYGIAFFIKVARGNLTHGEVDRMKLEALLAFRAKRPKAGESAPPSPQSAKAGVPVQQRKIQAPGQPIRHEVRAANAPAPSTSPSGQIPPSGPRTRVSPSQPNSGLDPASSAESASAVPAGERKHIKTATYEGPDRRMLADRRGTPADRRARCHTITFRNRRFGGDRRKTVRREEDRLKPKQAR